MFQRLTIIVQLVTAFALLLALAAATTVAAADPPQTENVQSRSHKLPIGPEQTLAVTEYFTASSEQRQPARAVVFLAGAEFVGNFWAIPVEGYNGPAMAARRGLFAFTFDNIGSGESSAPADGSKVNYRTNAAAVRKLTDFVRESRGVDRVDLVGEGYGAEVASVLASEPERVRSVAISTVVYKTFNPSFLGFFAPEREAALRGQPNGYWKPNFLEHTLRHSPSEELREYVQATQLVSYPTGPFLQYWDFGQSIIEASKAKVPALVVKGELSPIPAPHDHEELANDWGGGAKLVVIPGANHVPRIEAEEIAEQYFDALFGFIDP